MSSTRVDVVVRLLLLLLRARTRTRIALLRQRLLRDPAGCCPRGGFVASVAVGTLHHLRLERGSAPGRDCCAIAAPSIQPRAASSGLPLRDDCSHIVVLVVLCPAGALSGPVAAHADLLHPAILRRGADRRAQRAAHRGARTHSLSCVRGSGSGSWIELMKYCLWFDPVGLDFRAGGR